MGWNHCYVWLSNPTAKRVSTLLTFSSWNPRTFVSAPALPFLYLIFFIYRFISLQNTCSISSSFRFFFDVKPATVIELCASHGNVILGSRRQQLFIDLPRLQSRFVCFIVFIFFCIHTLEVQLLKKACFLIFVHILFNLKRINNFFSFRPKAR